MLPMHHIHSRMQVVAHIMSTDTTDLVCTRGHRRSCVGNRTSCEIGWSRGLMIVILTCAMIMPVYFPEHGGMSQRAQQPHVSFLFVCSCSVFRDANSSRSAACAYRIRDSEANLQLLFSILREVRWKCRVYSPRAIHMDGPFRLGFVKVLQGWRARPLRPADHQAAGGASWMDLSSVRKH